MKKENVRHDDFSPVELPKTRRALFSDLCHHEWRTLFSTSFLLALFALPLFSDYLAFSVFISSAYSSGAEMSSIFALFFYAGIIAIPCIVILFIGLAGAYEVGKQLSFLEGVFTTTSFFYGIKKNAKADLVMGMIASFSFALAFIGSLYLLLFYQASPIPMGIGIGLLIFQFIVVSGMAHFYLSQEAIYANSVGASLKNAFLFTLMKLPQITLVSLLSPGLFIALLAINDIAAYVAMAVFVLFSAWGILVSSLYTHAVFDRFINESHYPELVGKGLYKKED